MVQLRLAQPLPLVPGDRFVVRANVTDPVREGLTTLGGGRVLGVSNVRLRRQKPWTITSLRARHEAIDDPLRWCELRVRETGAPTVARDMARESLLRPDETADLLERLRAEGRLLQTPSGAWVHREVLEQTAERLLSEIQSYHSVHPEHLGIGREALLDRLKVNPELLDLGMARSLERGQVQQSGALLAVTGWKAQVADSDQRLSDQVEARLRQAGWAPPSLEELAASLGESPARVSAAARFLADHETIVCLEERVWMHRDAVEAGRQTALRLLRRAPSFSTMEFRDALGVSRKFAVPLLDHLDKVRFTVRSGHHRTPGAEAKKLLSGPPTAAAS